MRVALCAVFIILFTIQSLAVGAASGKIDEMFARVPLSFEPNVGQAPESIRFLSRAASYDVFLLQAEALLEFPSSQKSSASHSIRIKFASANNHADIEARELLTGHVNYFLGTDETKWKTNIPTYGQVRYRNLYPGIDLAFYGAARKLEYDFIIAPGADPNALRLSVEGADSISIGKNGDLLLQIGANEVRFRLPFVYQEIGGKKKQMEGTYFLEHAADRSLIGFKVGPYDRTQALIIDPVLDYSTYLGGTGQDWASSIAVNNAGEAYVTGSTESFDFPTTARSVFPTHAPCNPGTYCSDVFIAKFNAKGNALVYSTYLGGSNDEYGSAIAVDASGSAYVTGTTNSTDFPTTGGAVQRSCGGTCYYNDGFVTKIDPTGSALAYSTYIGGSDEDDGTGIDILNGNAYVSGFSASTDFPTTAGAYQRQMQGQASSFVIQLNSNGTALNYATFIGEVDLYIAGPGIAVDSSGNSYLAGVTLSSNFPVTQGAFHTPFVSGLVSNSYITKLNPSGSNLIYSAVLGGVGAGHKIAIDAKGNAYVSGSAGPFYPLSPGALHSSCSNGTLVAALSPDGSNLESSALVCSESLDYTTVTRDIAGNILVFGDTTSSSMPTTVGAFQTSIANGCCFADTFLARLTPDFSALSYSSYFGGSGPEMADGAVSDSAGNMYLTGSTSSTDLPLRNAFQSTNAGNGDAFVAKVTLPKTSLSVYPAILNFDSYGKAISSAPLSVTLANVSKSAISISDIGISGDFTQTNDCGKQLPAGHQCAVKVIFKPTKIGIRKGSLVMQDSAGKQSVPLDGTGVNGPVVKFSSNYQIVNEPSGITSPPLTVKVFNFGNKNLTISEIDMQGGAWNVYGNTNCFAPVKPNGHCNVQVDYTPSSYCWQGGDYSGLQFIDNAGNGSQGFGLDGACGPSGVAFLSYGTRFDPVPVGQKSAIQSVAVVNGFSSGLSIASIVASENFSQTNNCPKTLNPGAYCYVRVISVPTQAEILQGTVTITDTSNNVYTLPLLGTGSAK
jgi:hypothetical protein